MGQARHDRPPSRPDRRGDERMTRLWIVRAGKQGDRELAAIEQGRLLPGFLEVGDLRLFPDRNAWGPSPSESCRCGPLTTPASNSHELSLIPTAPGSTLRKRGSGVVGTTRSFDFVSNSNGTCIFLIQREQVLDTLALGSESGTSVEPGPQRDQAPDAPGAGSAASLPGHRGRPVSRPDGRRGAA